MCSTCHVASELPGAHAAHLTRGAFSLGVQCADCHPAYSDTSHSTAAVTVAFGALATSGGAQPSWNASAGTCSNGYCHGAGSTLGWDAGAAAVTCGTCHGIPPSTGHVQIGLAYCSVCHPGITAAGAVLVDAGTHVDGVTELKADAGHPDGFQPPGHPNSVDFSGCTVCHASKRSCSSCH